MRSLAWLGLTCTLVAQLACTASSKDTDTDTDIEAVDNDGDGVLSDVDCDDANAEIHPDAEELCDQVDNNCNGETDSDSADATLWYADADFDGHGDANETVMACTFRPGLSTLSDDCDDGDPLTNPSAADCLNQDRDCDGSYVQSGADVVVQYIDRDRDGFGDWSFRYPVCGSWDAFVDTTPDCDDLASNANPDAVEVCGDGLDNDCNGLMDCEDSMCDGEPACVEVDCTDGIDDDNDGLTDCYDDQCWGDASCDVVVSTVQGGEYFHQVTGRYTMTVYPSFRTASASVLHNVILESVTGTMVNYQASSATACQWSASVMMPYTWTSTPSLYPIGLYGLFTPAVTTTGACGFSSPEAYIPSQWQLLWGPDTLHAQVDQQNARWGVALPTYISTGGSQSTSVWSSSTMWHGDYLFDIRSGELQTGDPFVTVVP